MVLSMKCEPKIKIRKAIPSVKCEFKKESKMMLSIKCAA